MATNKECKVNTQLSCKNCDRSYSSYMLSYGNVRTSSSSHDQFN
jgi:hypothetical protein